MPTATPSSSDSRRRIGLIGLVVLLLGLGGWFAFGLLGGSGASDPVAGNSSVAGRPDELQGERQNQSGESRSEASEQRATLAVDPNSITGVRGVVLDARTRAPMPGVEVVALRMLPNLERPMTRFRSLFQDGLYVDTSRPVEILGSTVTLGDGSFELLGLPKGRVFLDARSENAYVRNPGAVRLARGQIAEQIELLASPGGRIVGRVMGPEGTPSANTRVSVRPGLNSFLGQLTQRKYKWLEVMTDEEGRYEISGVPTGDGYSVTYASPDMAMEERHGIDVGLGQTVRIDVNGKIGASVTGRAIDAGGAPVAGARIAMVYLDISRMIFSADGREEAIQTDANGYFQLQHVAAGRVAFIAATDQLAPSNIHELAVVDGGVYTDVVLTLDEGSVFTGLVVDGKDRPLPGVDVEIRPSDGGDGRESGSDALKMALKIRRLQSQTDGSGRFTTTGIAGKRLTLTFRKDGYITVRKRGTRVDAKDFKVKLTRGATVRGRVMDANGKPIQRFRVRVASREPRTERKSGQGRRSGDADSASDVAKGAAEATEQAQRSVREGRTEVRFGGRRGRFRGRGPRGRRRNGSTSRLPEGSKPGRGGRDRWEEVKSAAGRFSIAGRPHGEIRVEVRAEGYLDTEEQSVELAAGATSDELEFVLKAGSICRGIVKDEATGRPVAEATVTAYLAKKKEKDDDGGFALFRPDADAEDFDFLGMSKEQRRSSMTNSRGEFEIRGLKGGDYRFTARHPDMAKASVKAVKVAADAPTEGIEIVLTAGGAIEGIVTGKGQLPLGNAMVLAVSLQAGSVKSDATDSRGFYRIDGLPPGQYIVFKSKINERTTDIGLDVLSNMRLKSTTVRRNKTTRRDIHDETDDSVRIYGVVRDNGKPVPRAVITVLGRDKDGILGMGIRTKPTNEDGSYEILGLGAGDYLVQVARYRSRAEQSNLTIEIPEGVREFRVDIDMPQSYLEGLVQDSAGNPAAGVHVQVGLEDEAPVDGLLGIMMKNGIAQAKTDEAGRFKVEGLAEGRYRLTVTGRGVRFGRGMPGALGGKSKYGQAKLDKLDLDGVNPIRGLVVTLPLAGRITGLVVDGTGAPLAGAEIVTRNEDRKTRRENQKQRGFADLFGLQMRPIKTDANGRFEIDGLSPGKYRVTASFGELAPDRRDNVEVFEGQPTEIRLRVMQGATLKVRVRNISGENMPIAKFSVLDGKGKSIVRDVSAMSIFMRYMRGKKKKDSSGWHEFGGIPPDTYTLIIQEKGQPELRVVRTVRDGEKARWDIDMAAELEKHKNSKE